MGSERTYRIVQVPEAPDKGENDEVEEEGSEDGEEDGGIDWHNLLSLGIRYAWISDIAVEVVEREEAIACHVRRSKQEHLERHSALSEKF